mmetsp:Transcript_8299/g.13418  ORF Transcript_8299/g.13418 Transcript_8299/m.13418 type:complete len:202 (-) Transcript_8299:447-1052(-)
MHETLRLSQRVRADALSIQEQINDFHKSALCKDDHQGVYEASKGNAKTCQEALKLYQLNEANCEDNLGFGPLSVLCPQTCEICTDPLSLLQRINSLNSEVLHAHALLNRVAAAAAAAIDDDLGSSNNQAIGSSSGSSTTSRSRLLFRNPKQELRRFAMEIKLRYEKGTLLKPIFDTVASIKGMEQPSIRTNLLLPMMMHQC